MTRRLLPLLCALALALPAAAARPRAGLAPRQAPSVVPVGHVPAGLGGLQGSGLAALSGPVPASLPVVVPARGQGAAVLGGASRSPLAEGGAVNTGRVRAETPEDSKPPSGRPSAPARLDLGGAKPGDAETSANAASETSGAAADPDAGTEASAAEAGSGFDLSGVRPGGAGAVLPGEGGSSASPPSGLARPEEDPGERAWLRAYVRERLPAAEESGLEGVAFDEAAADRRVDQLMALGRRMAGLLDERLYLEPEEARALWREILREHPTVFGYHIPEHTHQPLMVILSVLDHLASIDENGRAVLLRALEGETRRDRAALEDFNLAPRPELGGLSKAVRMLRARRELEEAGPAAGMLDWVEKEFRALAQEHAKLVSEDTQNLVLRNVLEAEVTEEDRTLLMIAAILHDVDPAREEGTLARVAATREWLDTPRGEGLLRRLAAGRLGNLRGERLKEVKAKVLAYILATDFQYDPARKAAIWPAFLEQARAAWGVRAEVTRENYLEHPDPTVRKVVSLGHLIRVADQYGAYSLAASLTPEDPRAAWEFMEFQVRMLKRELRRTSFVPPFLRALGVEDLLAGTYSFLIKREVGSPTADEHVAGAEGLLSSLSRVLIEVNESANRFFLVKFPGKRLDPKEHFPDPETAESFLWKNRDLPDWFVLAHRPQDLDKAAFYDKVVAAYLSVDTEKSVFRTMREQVEAVLAERGIEIVR